MTDDTNLILQRIGEMDERLSCRMDKMESRMDGMESRMDGMESRMDVMESKMDVMESKMDVMESKMDGMASRMDGMESELNSIKLNIENVTNRNIQIIAEGHLDLSRKLDDALKQENEKEMNRIRLNILEDKVEKIENVVFA